jgi:hypothetical protein
MTNGGEHFNIAMQETPHCQPNFYLPSNTFPPINLSLTVHLECSTIELVAHSTALKYKVLGYLAKEGF